MSERVGVEQPYMYRGHPDFYNDLYCIQKLEKDYPFYDKMLVEFKECQDLLFNFHTKIDGYLSSETLLYSEVVDSVG